MGARNHRRGRNIACECQVSLLGDGEGWLFYGHQKVPPTHGPRTGEQGLHSKGQALLGCRLCPCHTRRIQTPLGHRLCLLHCGTSVRTSSMSRCHLPPPWGQSPAWAPATGAADSGAERCHYHHPDRWWMGEPLGGWESHIGAAGPGTNHDGAGGVCTLAGFKGPTDILHFAPEEMQISPSPGQRPRQMGTELQQHPCNAHPSVEMPTVSCSAAVQLSPTWAHPGVAVGDGEATKAALVPGWLFPSATLRCLQACFPSPTPPPGQAQVAPFWGHALRLQQNLPRPKQGRRG